MNVLELQQQAALDAATPVDDWLATHAPHGPVVEQPTGVASVRHQVPMLRVCPCGATYAEAVAGWVVP